MFQGGPSKRGTIAVGALASSAMLASFLQTIMTPLIPSLPATFDADAASVSWVLTAALLAACATAPMAGRIGDILGKRRVLLALLGVIVVGSVIGALSTTLAGVITARALQGVGLGVMALNVSVLKDTVSPRRLPAAVAAVSASNGIGGALGLPLSAAVSQYFDWHGLFWLAAILATVCALGILFFVKGGDRTSPTRFDWVGGLLLAAGLSGVILAIAQGAVWDWRITAAVAVAGIIVLTVWTLHELRTAQPLIDLRIVFRGPVLIVNLIGITSGFCWFAIPGLVARLLQSEDGTGPGLGLDMVTASIVIVPTGLSMLLGAPVAQRVVRRFGPRVAILSGSLLTAVAYTVGLLWMQQPWQLAIVACLVGMGSVLVFSSASLVILAYVPTTATGASNGVNSVMRWLGSTLSSALIGAILAYFAFSYEGVPVPALDGYRLAFVLALTAGAIGAGLSLFLPRRRAVAP